MLTKEKFNKFLYILNTYELLNPYYTDIIVAKEVMK